MPFSILDLVVLGVVIISALLAAVRGFARETLAILAWIAAAAAAWFLHPQALPFVKQYVKSDTIALVGAIAGIFLVTLIVVSIITVRISDLFLDSRIGALDRTLGFVFGAARGFLICTIGWVLLSWFVQGKNPSWAETARTRPSLESSGESLMNTVSDLFPWAEKTLQDFRSKALPDATEATEPTEPDPQKIAPQPPQAPPRRS